MNTPRACTDQKLVLVMEAKNTVAEGPQRRIGRPVHSLSARVSDWLGIAKSVLAHMGKRKGPRPSAITSRGLQFGAVCLDSRARHNGAGALGNGFGKGGKEFEEWTKYKHDCT